ncbi:MAG: hypothetical protein LBU37_12105 [Tannerellaceae bacterium]|nr:hypothetical protein [Tannerellaceae bacterium]
MDRQSDDLGVHHSVRDLQSGSLGAFPGKNEGGLCVMVAESPQGAGGERGLGADSPTRPDGGARPGA